MFHDIPIFPTPMYFFPKKPSIPTVEHQFLRFARQHQWDQAKLTALARAFYGGQRSENHWKPETSFGLVLCNLGTSTFFSDKNIQKRTILTDNIYIYIHTYIYIYTYMCMYIYIYIYMCMYVCVLSFFTHVHVYVFKYLYMYRKKSNMFSRHMYFYN